MLGITTTNARVGGFRGGISAEAKTIYNRIIADGGVSNLTRLNFFVKGLKAIYGDLANVPVCYDAHWIGYKLGSGTGATAGQAAAKLYSLTVAGDAVQSTAASQPLLLAHNGDNYYFSAGVIGNYCRSDLSYNTSDLDFTANVSLLNTGGAGSRILGNRTTGNGWTLTMSTTTFELEYSVAGVFFSAIATTTNTLKTYYSIRVQRNSTTGAITFTKDGVLLTTTGTQLLGTLNGTTNPLEVGGSLGGVQAAIHGVKSAVFYIGGVLNRTFNPATYNASTSQTAWTSSTGEVWTISTGTATTGYKGCLVSRTIVQSDGVDDEMSSSAFAINQPNTSYTVYNYYNDISKTVIDGLTNDTRNLLTSSSVGITGLYAGTATFNVSGFSKIVRQLRTFGLNGITSYGMANNSSRTTGIAGVLNASGVHLFRGGNGFGNNTFYTHINTSILDTAQNNTDMYNLVRSLNENAF